MLCFRPSHLLVPGLRYGGLQAFLCRLQHSDTATPSHIFQDGELALLMEPRRHHKPRLLRLNSSRHTETSVGRFSHVDVIGQEVGVQPRTTLGGRVTLRRPSLEEYTLLMSRGATPSYSSVVYTAVCMMDIGSGSKVVEAGTGSGAMTLHLSRIVGAEGCVLSFEVSPTHLKIARRNVAEWAESWDLSHPEQREKWPDNVRFHSAGVQEAQGLIDCAAVDAVFLDLPHVTSVLGAVVDLLRPCGLAVLFLPNITQAVEVDVHIRATQLPLQTEDIVGVCHQHWTVKPSRTKRLVTPNNERAHSPECQDHGTSERCESSEVTPLTATPYLNYICRPNHRQPPHTGFLMKMRRL